MATAVQSILQRHPNDRILVHTVSYDLTRYLDDRLRQSDPGDHLIVSYTGPSDRDYAIRTYTGNPGGVLLAPSLDRGLDLPDDDCRVIVVCKVPYPNLGDKQVNARIHSKGGELWYIVQTIRSLVQMTGRGMRSESDYCASYILDTQFINSIYRKYRHLLPSWWKEALITQGLGKLI